MIVSNYSSPNKSLYLIGANIIEVISSYKSDRIDLLKLHQRYNELHQHISLSYLIYGLDWLFLAGAVGLTESGDLELCS